MWISMLRGLLKYVCSTHFLTVVKLMGVGKRLDTQHRDFGRLSFYESFHVREDSL